MAEGIEGGVELRLLALRLKVAGEIELKKAMYRNIRLATLPAKSAVAQSAMQTLPSGGGLNAYVASAKVSTNVLIGPKTAGVRIRVRKAGHDMKDMDAGQIRHPVYRQPGRKSAWVSQTVTPGFATNPLLALRPLVGAGCYIAMRETAEAAGFH